MSIIYKLTDDVTTAQDLATFVTNARAHFGGPRPQIGLVSGQLLQQDQSAFAPTDGNAQNTMCVGLITCAAVIYGTNSIQAAPGLWVHHAGSGVVYAHDVQAALAGLGGPPADSVLVVFAHRGRADRGYLTSMITINQAGVSANNIIEIPDLPTSFFGVNNLGQIG